MPYPLSISHSLGAVALVVSMLVSCSPSVDSDPAHESGVSHQSATSTSTPEAPPAVGFPDLSTFTESGDQFVQEYVPRVQGFSFSTPTGLICGSNAYPEPKFEHVGCRGPVPSQGPGDWSVEAGYSESGTIESLSGDPDFAADKRRPPAVLPPMHKVTSLDGVAVCGVDDAGTVACRVDDHGFMITATETKVF
jgi:hypothetical protein